LVHPQRGTHEHVPGAAQHHHERPHLASPPAARVDPPAQVPVVDLRLPASGDRVAQHDHLVAADLLGQVRHDIPLHRGEAGPQTVLVAQPLMDRRLRHAGLELGHDVVVVHSDLRPGHLPQARVVQVRKPAQHQRRPIGRRHHRTAWSHPRRDRWSDVLTDRLPVHAERDRHLADGTTRIPVDQDFGHIDHVETPPRHRLPRPS
jgi:hypothetical protein